MISLCTDRLCRSGEVDLVKPRVPSELNSAAARNRRWNRVVRILVPVCVLVASLTAFLANLSAVAGFVGNLTGHQSVASIPTAVISDPAPTSSASTALLIIETSGGEAHTWTDYQNAGGIEGPTIAMFKTVQISCRLVGFKVADGNPWWYRIASSPWSNNYYVSADAFYNNGQVGGTLVGTPWFDSRVPIC